MIGFQLAALDMAGTTIDEEGIVYDVLEDVASEAIGGPIPHDVLDAWKGTSKWEALEGILGELEGDNRPSTIDRHFASFTERLTNAYRTTPPSPFPGVEDAIAEMRAAGVKVALQTGYSADIADAILAGIRWRVGPSTGHTIDALVTSDLVAESRPAPYLIFRCMEETGVHDVRAVISAGDTPNDVWAGYNAGCGVVAAVLSGSFDRAGFLGSPYTTILEGVSELTTLL